MSGEKKLWESLRPKLNKYGHFERIESHETAVGTPDVDYCIAGYSNKLELKHTKREHGCHLRPSQCGWFKARVKAGGQPWLLLRADVRDTRGHALIAGSDVPALVHTRDVKRWLEAAAMVWGEKIIVEQLIEFLSVYLIVDTIPQEKGQIIMPGGKIIT